jgi:hypothetical protein
MSSSCTRNRCRCDCARSWTAGIQLQGLIFLEVLSKGYSIVISEEAPLLRMSRSVLLAFAEECCTVVVNALTAHTPVLPVVQHCVQVTYTLECLSIA